MFLLRSNINRTPNERSKWFCCFCGIIFYLLYSSPNDSGLGAGPSKQNGSITQKPDRYGFFGGEQYTEPGL